MRSSVKNKNAVDDELIDRTLETWQPRVDHPLSRDDARQIIGNVSGFFSLLAEWAKADASNNHVIGAYTSEARHDR